MSHGQFQAAARALGRTDIADDPRFAPRLGAYARKKLGERDVEVRLGVRLEGAKEDLVVLSDGSRIPTRTLVWTAGTARSANSPASAGASGSRKS